MNNNNNRNNNGIGETLFWKVFSNVYLLNYIIKKVQTVEWVIYNDHKKISRRNKLKFKEIFLLDWMAEKKQYPLLKYKIKCDDFIQIDTEAIEYIFEHLSKLTQRIKLAPDPVLKKYVSPIEIALKKEKKEIDRQKEIISLTEVIKLLLEHKRIEFEISDLTRIAVKYDCLDVLKILTSEPYSIIVYPSALESAIVDCHPSMVKELLSLKQSFNLVTDDLKTRSLKLACENKYHNNEMVEFILDDPNLYQVKNKEDIPLQTTFKLLDYFLTFKEFFQLTSIKSKNKLMELDMVIMEMEGTEFSIVNDLSATQSFEEMVLLDRIHCKYFTAHHTYDKSLEESIENIINKYGESSEENKEIKLKELMKLLIIKYKPPTLYNEYIQKFKESIDEFHEDGFITSDDDHGKFLTLFRYIGIVGYVNQTSFKIQLESSLKKVKDQKLKCYPLLDSIEIKNVHKRILHINNQELLDWLLKCDFELVNTFIQRHVSIQYLTLKLWEYAKLINIKLSVSASTIDGSLSNCFTKAFKECDIDTLISLESHVEVRLIAANLQLPDDELKINQLINHYNSTRYKGFTMPFFYEIFKCAIIKVPSISFSNVLMDFASFPVSTTNLWFVSSILALDFRITEIFFNNFKHIIFTEEQFQEFTNAEKNLFDSNKSIFHHYDYDENELISLVGILMNKFNQREILRDSEKGQIEIQSYQSIFNYYFQILIQIEFISLDKVYSIHKLLVDNSFDIQHTLYHSFYYLQLRSPKFIKRLLCTPGLDTFFDVQVNCFGIFSARTIITDPYTDQDGIGGVGKYNGFNFQKYLNINQFTFDYILGVAGIDVYNDNKRIFKHSFDEILGKLVYELSIKLASTEKQIVEDFCSLTLNEDLGYFLDSRRFDLFFDHLDYIQSKLQKQETMESTGNSGSEDIQSDQMFKQQSKNTFKFSDNVIDLAVKLLYPSDLQRFLEFNYHVDTIVDKIYNRSIFANRYDNAKFLLDNYSIDIINFPSYSISLHYNYNHRGEFKFITDNYFHLVSDPKQFKYKQLISTYTNKSYPSVFVNHLINHLSSHLNIPDYYKFISLFDQNDQTIIETLVKELQDNLITAKIIVDQDVSIDKEKKSNLLKIILNNLQIQSLIKSTFDNYLPSKLSSIEIEKCKLVNEYIDQDDSMFNEAFIFGDIKMCNLILNCYPSIFKITKQSVKKVLENYKIHIIKYFYNPDNSKLLINSFQSDIELLQYLKDLLLIHDDYKFNLNWL